VLDWKLIHISLITENTTGMPQLKIIIQTIAIKILVNNGHNNHRAIPVFLTRNQINVSIAGNFIIILDLVIQHITQIHTVQNTGSDFSAKF